MVRSQTDFLMEFDDFSEVFDNVGLRICWGFIMMIELTFSNAFNFFFIMFDKYGEDPLKRSLNNQLISQVGYPVMLHNFIVVPAWSWRVFIGPLNLVLADLVLLTGNAIVIWISLCFLENLIVKAGMVIKYVLKEVFVLLKIKHWIGFGLGYLVSM